MSLNVTNVQWLGGHRLLLHFENGETREVDLEGRLSFDGVFEPLRDPAYFGTVRMEPDIGTIVWPSGADFCPDVLYEISRPCRDAAPVSSGS